MKHFYKMVLFLLPVLSFSQFNQLLAETNSINEDIPYSNIIYEDDLVYAKEGVFIQELIITEIMYNPSGSETVWEWVEIYNSGTEDIDLSGYVVDDSNRTKHSSANIESGNLAVGESVILYDSDAIFEEDFRAAWGNVNLIPVSNWNAFALNNTGDTIGIWSSFSSYEGDHRDHINVIAQVVYEKGKGGWPENDGFGSIYLKDLALDYKEGENWALSTIGLPSPLNSIYSSFNLGGNPGTDIGSPGSTLILDTEAPAINCREDLNLITEIDECGIAKPIENPEATDNISTNFTYMAVRSDGLEITDVFPIGITTITWTATDEADNVSESCNQLVTVADNVLPIAVCQDTTVLLDAFGVASLTTSDIDAGSSDNCDGFTISLDKTEFTATDLGENTVTLTVIDTTGNVTSCTAIVTVIDNVLPVTKCKPITVQLDETGKVTIMAESVNDGSFDAVGIQSMSVFPNTFDCTQIGIVTTELTVVDTSGSSSKCIAQLVVEDKVLPEILCEPDKSLISGDGNPVVVTIVSPNVSDNCDESPIVNGKRSDELALEAPYPVGVTTIVWTAIDNSGNVAECIQTISVTFSPRTGNQIITFLIENQIGITSINLEEKEVRIVMPFESDLTNVSPLITVSLGAIISPSSEEIQDFTNPIEYTVTAENEEEEKWIILVTVEADIIQPTIVCVEDIIVSNDEGLCGAVVNFSITSSDNRPGEIIEQIEGLESGAYFSAGETINSFAVTDTSGNTATCSFTVKVVDDENPVAKCKSISLQLDASGTAAITWEDVNDGATDNCSIVDYVVTPSSFTIADIGDNLVTFTVTDSKGNSSSCEVNVNVSAVKLGEIWLEAECGIIGGNWNVVNDEKASGGQYLKPPAGNNYNSASTDIESIVTYNFNAMGGYYKMYALVKAPTRRDDSFWIRVNGGDWIKWNRIPGGNSFNWHQVHKGNNVLDLVSFNLLEGSNSIEISNREDGVSLDKLYFKEIDPAPEGFGQEAIDCPIIPDLVDDIWLEAECAIVGSKWKTISSSEASEGSYLIPPEGNCYSSAPKDISSVVAFNFIAASGEYKMYALVKAPTRYDDSFWIRVNGGSWLKWNKIPGSNSFNWSRVHNGNNVSDLLSFNLLEGDNTIEISNREDGVSLDKLYLTKTDNLPGGFGHKAKNCLRIPDITNEIWLEAECGEVGSKWSLVNDGKASGGSYLVPPFGNNYNKAPSDKSSIVTFNFIATSGKYKIYTLVKAPTSHDDSFWIRVNGSSWFKWNRIRGNDSFNWFRVHKGNNVSDVVSFNLLEGNNTIEISNREDGVSLDKLYLTKTDNLPGGFGLEATNCLLTVTGKSLFGKDMVNSNVESKKTKNEIINYSAIAELKLTPNPASGNVTATVSNANVDVKTFYMFAIDGTLVKQFNGNATRTGSNSYDLGISIIQNGVYLIKAVVKNSDTLECKLIVTNR
ncbi:MAG: HYR domain-containing protein [Cellulophaga sp.]